jgi:ABC-type oligopeptide transport system ATPase subunit
MSTRARMVALLRDLDDPKSMVSLVETHDRRTISAAEKQGLVMIYAPQMVMRTEIGEAYLTLEEV